MINRFDYLVVGAGLSGATMAERLASAGARVCLIDKRDHVAGNAYDKKDAHGVLVHVYGPHIFHTNSVEVFEYLSLFTSWIPYRHRVLSCVNGNMYPFPINRTTVNKLYGLDLDEKGIAEYFSRVREPCERIGNSEEMVVSAVGRDLFETFYAGYTRKQWGMEARELKAGVTARIPFRTNDDECYFTDRYQVMPSEGYTKMIENMLDHADITVELGVDFFDLKNRLKAARTIYTGPVDQYFDYCYGKLPYRSIYFEHIHHHDTDRVQPVGTINYPDEDECEFTRVTEFKHLTGQSCTGTSVVREYPRAEGEPYYPIPTDENEALYRRYKALADRVPDVIFTGRLARYKYYNMDQVVAASLKQARKLIATDYAAQDRMNPSYDRRNEVIRPNPKAA